MKAYENFAMVYDLFMKDVEYDEWVKYIEKIWQKNGLNPKIVADLGCGTGNVTLRLAKKDIEMIGVDLSYDMLSIAKNKAYEQGKDILFLCQDMREFELFGTVDCVLSLFDSLNYITEKEDLLKVFKLVNNYLNPGGLFIFDLNTEYKFENILGENVFAQTEENAAYVWENYYDEEEEINEFYMNFFIKDEEEDLYKRFEECHYEKSYSIETIKTLLKKSNLELLNVYDAYTFESPKADSERIFFVAKEISK